MGVPNTSVRPLVQRIGRLLVAVLCLLAVLSVSAAADQIPNGIAQDVTAGRQTMGFEYLRDNPDLFGYGVTADLVGQPITPLLNGVAAMHLNWIRQPIRWADIEPVEGTYAWELLDQVVSEVRIRGFHLLLTIDGTPSWARPLTDYHTGDGPPADPAAFGNFLTAVSTRYAGLVDAYQIWQSPNRGAHWGGRPSPHAYLQFCQIAYQAIKAADPDAIVVSGDLEIGSSGLQSDDLDGLVFLEEMMQANVANRYDILGLSVDPSDGMVTEWVTESHQLVSRAAGIPIWITRAGSSCLQTDSAELAVCEERQAANLIQLVAEIESLPSVRAFMIDNFNLSTIDANHPDAGKSLMRPDWSPRPAFLAFARMRQEQHAATRPVPESVSHNVAFQSWPKSDSVVVKE